MSTAILWRWRLRASSCFASAPCSSLRTLASSARAATSDCPPPKCCVMLSRRLNCLALRTSSSGLGTNRDEDALSLAPRSGAGGAGGGGVDGDQLTCFPEERLVLEAAVGRRRGGVPERLGSAGGSRRSALGLWGEKPTTSFLSKNCCCFARAAAGEMGGGPSATPRPRQPMYMRRIAQAAARTIVGAVVGGGRRRAGLRLRLRLRLRVQRCRVGTGRVILVLILLPVLLLHVVVSGLPKPEERPGQHLLRLRALHLRPGAQRRRHAHHASNHGLEVREVLVGHTEQVDEAPLHAEAHERGVGLEARQHDVDVEFVLVRPLRAGGAARPALPGEQPSVAFASQELQPLALLLVVHGLEDVALGRLAGDGGPGHHHEREVVRAVVRVLAALQQDRGDLLQLRPRELERLQRARRVLHLVVLVDLEARAAHDAEQRLPLLAGLLLLEPAGLLAEPGLHLAEPWRCESCAPTEIQTGDSCGARLTERRAPPDRWSATIYQGTVVPVHEPARMWQATSLLAWSPRGTTGLQFG